MSSLFISLKSAVADHALIAVEGVYGAGKSRLIRMLTGCLPDLAVIPDYIFPTKFFDAPALGRVIYPIQNRLKGASAGIVIVALGAIVMIENHILSVMEHHYAAENRRLEQVADIFGPLIPFGPIQSLDLTDVVLREQSKLLRVDNECRWKTEQDFLGRQDFFYRQAAATMTNFATRIELIENRGNWTDIV